MLKGVLGVQTGPQGNCDLREKCQGLLFFIFLTIQKKEDLCYATSKVFELFAKKEEVG